jgi:hypothetical protein
MFRSICRKTYYIPSENLVQTYDESHYESDTEDDFRLRMSLKDESEDESE